MELLSVNRNKMGSLYCMLSMSTITDIVHKITKERSNYLKRSVKSITMQLVKN